MERKTGRPVEVYPDRDLETYATVKMAKGSAHAHLLRYNPDKESVDYHVAYQCGFVLRLFANPTGERYEFGSSVSGRDAVRDMVSGKRGIAKKLGLPKSGAEQLTEQFFSGLLTQLRSYPIGMRVDRWIREEHPHLGDDQQASMDRQQRENTQVLDPRIRQMSPEKVFSANVSMNAAYALFCERLLSASQYTVPYRSAGFEEKGKKLLGIWDEIPDDPGRDRELVDAWAQELGVSGWYRWVPFEEGN